jgi:hypothetical protein
MRKNVLTAICLSFIMTGAFSQAVDVPLVNPSFEAPGDSVKINCSYIVGEDTTAFNEIPGFGWKIDSCNDVGREDPNKFGDPNRAAAEGDPNKFAFNGWHVAFSHNNSGRMYQVVGKIDKVGAKYTFSGQSIYSYSGATSAFSCVYISLFSGKDATTRTVAAGDSVEYVIADLTADPTLIAWEKISVSYTTTAADIGKTLCVEFGNSASDSWTYFYHDAFTLTRLGGTVNVNTTGKSNISIYPNPSTNGKIRVKGINNGCFTVYDVLGKNVFSGVIKNSFQAIDLSRLSKGVYFIELNSNENSLRSKLVIK